jgi:hypothetical protein
LGRGGVLVVHNEIHYVPIGNDVMMLHPSKPLRIAP